MSVYNLLVRIGADASGLLAGIEKSSKSLKAMGERMDKIGKDMSMKLTAPIAALGTVAAKSAIDFESAFAGVRKTVDATEEQYAQLEKGIRNMAKTIPASAGAIASVAEAAGQLGIERENILGFSRVMIDLGESTNLSADQAATSLARLANITQMPQTEFGRLGSTVVALGNSLATTEAEIVEMGLRLAGAGKQVGMSEAQILGFAGALSSVGIAAEAGGTAFSRVFKDIYSAVKTGNESLSTFAQVAGVTTAQFKQQFETDAAGAMISFIEGLGKIGSQGGNTIAILDKLNLSDIRVSDSLLRASGAGDLFRKSIETGSSAWQENTALTKEAEERYKTLASVLARTKNYLADLAITFGQDMMPTIREVAGHVRALVERFAALDSGTRRNIIIAGALVAAVGPLLVVFGALAGSMVNIITLLAKIPPLFAAGSKGAALMAASVKGLGAAFKFLLGPAGLALTAVTAITAATVKANQAMQTVLDNQMATYDKTGKAVSEATAIYARFAKGATLTAEEAKKGAIGLRLLAAEATNPNVKKGLLEKAAALQKVVEESKKAAQTTGTGPTAPIIDVDAILAGAGDAAKALKPIEDSVKAAELSFQGLYARFRQIDTEAKYLGTGSIDVLRQKIQALEGQIRDSLAFTGPMTGDQRTAFDQAVKSLEEYRKRLKGAEEAQKDLSKSAKEPKSALQNLQASVSDVLSSINGLRDGLTTMATAFGINAENAVLGAVAAMGNFAMAGVQVWTSVSTLIPQLYSMGVAMHAALGPIGLVTGAVAVLAAGIAFLMSQQDEETKKAEESAKAWKEYVQKISSAFQSGFANSVSDTLKRYFSGDKINWLKDLSKGIREAVIDGMIQALVESSIIKGKMGALMDKLAGAVADGNVRLIDATLGEITARLPQLTKDLERAAETLKSGVDFHLPDPGSKQDGVPMVLPPLPYDPQKVIADAKGAVEWANRSFMGINLTSPQDWQRVVSDINTMGKNAVAAADEATAQALRNILSAGGMPIHFAHGGLVTGPTFGLIGEAGDDEAVLPLNDHVFEQLGGAIAEVLARRLGGGKGGDTYNVNIYPGIYVGDEAGKQQLARMFAIEINNLRMQAL